MMTAQHSIREFNNSAADYESLSRILSVVYPKSHRLAPRELERRDSEFANAKCAMIRYLAQDDQDSVIGSGVAYQMITSFHPQRFVVKVEVLESH